MAEAGVRAGCTEALFTLGDKPELKYPSVSTPVSLTTPLGRRGVEGGETGLIGTAVDLVQAVLAHGL